MTGNQSETLIDRAIVLFEEFTAAGQDDDTAFFNVIGVLPLNDIETESFEKAIGFKHA